MSTTIIRAHDAMPAYVGLSPDVIPDALYDLRAHQLNLLAYIIGEVQMRTAAPRRDRDEPARNERAKFAIWWLSAVTGLSHDRTLYRVEEIGQLPLGRDRPLHRVREVKGWVVTTVARAYAYPTPFIKVPLPLPVDDKRLTWAWLQLWTALHHGRRQPFLLRKPLKSLEPDLWDQLNHLLQQLDRERLDGHVIIPTRVGPHGSNHLAFTLPG